MKLNIANPSTGLNKTFEFDDEKKTRIFLEKRIAQDVDATPLGEQFKGYVLRIVGGNDKQGFPMKQGVLVNGRVRLLLTEKSGCYRTQTHDGERKRRTVRGCIVGNDLSVLNLIVVKKGLQEIEGLTDKTIPRRVGPKRASKIRKLFNLSKEDDVRKYVVRKTVTSKKDPSKTRSKAPKIQRLVTSVTLQRKKRRMSLKKRHFAEMRQEAKQYAEMLEQRAKLQKQKRQAEIQKRREVEKQRRLEKQKARTHRALKKIAKRAREVERLKLKAKSRKLTPEEKKQAIKKRRLVVKKRKQLVQRLIAMRTSTTRKLANAKAHFAKYPSRGAVRTIQKLKSKAHDLYLRIMSGGRLPNLKLQDKKRAAMFKLREERKVQRAEHKKLQAQKARRIGRKKAAKARRAARKAAAAGQPPAKKAKTN